jgi:hypothetical protein
MDITINTPALLFPAISLIMLAHTNRFLALANRVRSLHASYEDGKKQDSIRSQIRNLKYRLRLIKNMQALGIISFLVCIFSMYCIYIGAMGWANGLFAASLLLFVSSLLLSLLEIQLSTRALELELSDMEDIEDVSLVRFIKSKFERE